MSRVGRFTGRPVQCDGWLFSCRALKCFTAGYELVHLNKNSEQCIHRKALKALHALFDVEVGTRFPAVLDVFEQC